jgi:dual specificity MAP kinase phosphatase
MSHPNFNYNKITDQIYIGTNFCCQTHFDKDLLEDGVNADLSVEGERIDSPFGVEQYLWLPVTDHESPGLNQFQQGVQFINLVLQQGGKVYVHCMNGHGRSPSLVAAYFVKTGLDIDTAIATIKQARNEVHINEAQRAGLEEYQETL